MLDLESFAYPSKLLPVQAYVASVPPSEVPILENLSKAILEYVYSAPALVQLVQYKIDALKKKP